jgi:hypothetical protein
MGRGNGSAHTARARRASAGFVGVVVVVRVVVVAHRFLAAGLT